MGPGQNTEALDREWTRWMALAQDGDRVAYERLLRASVPVIRRVAQRRGGTPDDVDDIVQDVLLTIHRARQTFDPSRSYVAWLSAIARNRAIDAGRRRSRLDARERSAPEVLESFAGSDDPAGAAGAASEARRLRQAVAELPEKQRQAVQTLGLEEFSIDEAARLTGRTKSALKVNLHRGLKGLRARLGRAP